VYHLTAKGMHLTIMETLHASRVEKWIHAIKQQFLDAALIKCVGLYCEFTNPREGKHNQYITILQLSVVSDVLVFQICRANGVSQLLKEFLKDTIIRFCNTAITNDVRKLRSYRIEIPFVYDLQKIVLNPTKNPTLGLYDVQCYFWDKS
jgi:hypothetical protein